MNFSKEYERQFAWRDWDTALALLPELQGQTVLDLGCGVGDLSRQLVARGARVVGVDMNEDLIRTAASKGLPGADFRLLDLRTLAEHASENHLFPDQAVLADGLWCSMVAAYFLDLPTVLRSWARLLKPGGWLALIEVDDLFAHRPLKPASKQLLDAYVEESLLAGRYDFRMGRKLSASLEQAGFTLQRDVLMRDEEFCFSGSAKPEVLEAWRQRFERMSLLRSFCGADFEALRSDFLSCLASPDHVSGASVRCFLARAHDLDQR